MKLDRLQQLVKELRETTDPTEIRNKQYKAKERTDALKNGYYSEVSGNINSAAMAREKVEK